MGECRWVWYFFLGGRGEVEVNLQVWIKSAHSWRRGSVYYHVCILTYCIENVGHWNNVSFFANFKIAITEPFFELQTCDFALMLIFFCLFSKYLNYNNSAIFWATDLRFCIALIRPFFTYFIVTYDLTYCLL